MPNTTGIVGIKKKIENLHLVQTKTKLLNRVILKCFDISRTTFKHLTNSDDLLLSAQCFFEEWQIKIFSVGIDEKTCGVKWLLCRLVIPSIIFVLKLKYWVNSMLLSYQGRLLIEYTTQNISIQLMSQSL